ncbi:MAG: hypothetical protein AAB573_04720 [Patescibacteria group bacterium]
MIKTAHGFSTLEMLIAMSVIVLSLGAVVLLTSSSQNILVDSETSAEAQRMASSLVEQMQALSRKDFRLVNPVAPVTDPDGFYTSEVTVTDGPDYFSKLVTANVSWSIGPRPQVATLTSLVSNIENPVGADTCSSILTGDWDAPTVQSSTNGTYEASGIDAYHERLFVAARRSAGDPEPTFLVYDVSGASPNLLSSVDSATSTVAGLASVVSAGKYAFGASAVHADFASCDDDNGQYTRCGQLQVFERTLPSPETWELKRTYKVPNVEGDTGSGIGNAVTFKDGFIYLGLTETSIGDEFIVIDVHNPLAPTRIGSYDVGRTVTNILVRNGYAFVTKSVDASSPEELLVLNVSNPTAPALSGSFDGPQSNAHGESLYVVGDELYLARSISSGSEFYRLNIETPATPSSIDSKNVGLSLWGIVVRSGRVFALANDVLTSFPLSDPTDVTDLTVAGDGASLDCEGNSIYVSTNVSGQARIYVVGP